MNRTKLYGRAAMYRLIGVRLLMSVIGNNLKMREREREEERNARVFSGQPRVIGPN